MRSDVGEGGLEAWAPERLRTSATVRREPLHEQVQLAAQAEAEDCVEQRGDQGEADRDLAEQGQPGGEADERHQREGQPHALREPRRRRVLELCRRREPRAYDV